jgi:hypothetical protein
MKKENYWEKLILLGSKQIKYYKLNNKMIYTKGRKWVPKWIKIKKLKIIERWKERKKKIEIEGFNRMLFHNLMIEEHHILLLNKTELKERKRKNNT